MVDILEWQEQLIVRIGGQEYARYSWGTHGLKPSIYPLRAANGLSLVADCPTDHRHHHGIWIGHRRVNDSDFWLEKPESGRIELKSYSIASPEGGNSATIYSSDDWIDARGELILRDERSLTFYDMPTEKRWFDLAITLIAPSCSTVRLNQTNEAGIPHIRVADGLTVKTGGTLTNAEGRRNERGTYRQKSGWVDCSGRLGRLECGIAVFDHPENPAYPTPWFTRDYGPFSPNYGFFAAAPVEIEPGTPLVLRYRIYTHSGNVIDGSVSDAWDSYLAEYSSALSG